MASTMVRVAGSFSEWLSKGVTDLSRVKQGLQPLSAAHYTPAL
jgi:hypothetical protein